MAPQCATFPHGRREVSVLIAGGPLRMPQSHVMTEFVEGRLKTVSLGATLDPRTAPTDATDVGQAQPRAWSRKGDDKHAIGKLLEV